ncbi:hypothetical protein A0256_23650 [Mucilaginibacter sp. PAMC 26640]|nr:hypothetical protein A0256_23650 [Mucilaginibacter sp. PAMC 26640]
MNVVNYINMKIKTDRKTIFIASFLAVLICDFTIAANINIETNFVPDKKTAIKIAEAVWLPIYEKNIFKELDAHHFDAARPGKQADQLIDTIVKWLKKQGVKH